MKSIYSIILLAVIFSLFFTCSKPRETLNNSFSKLQQFTPLLSGDSANIYCYVLLTASQTVDKFDSSKKVAVGAAFTDSLTNQLLSMNGLVVNARTIVAHADHTYSLPYTDSSSALISEGLALIGTNVKIKVTGSTLADTVSQNVYLAKSLLRQTSDFPSGYLVKGNNLSLTWVTDPNNSLGQIGIQVTYYPLPSRLLDSTLPTQINSLQYFVPDNGSFTISSSDLSVFPANAYVAISMARACQVQSVLPVSHRRIFYFGVSSAATPPIVIKNPCNSSNCSGNDKKCINGSCLTGVLTVIKKTVGARCQTITEYVFPDGSVNVISNVFTNGPCQ